MTNDEDLTELLHFDALSAAEKLTGKSYKGDEETTSLGLLMHIDRNTLLAEKLKERNDTTFSMDMNDYLKIVEELGFEKLIEEKFTTYDDREETFYAYGMKDPLMILTCDSYSYKNDDNEKINHRNSAQLYFRWFGGPSVWNDLRDCSNGPMLRHEDYKNVDFHENHPRHADIDVREALRIKLNHLKKAEGHIFANWWNIGVDDIFDGYPRLLSSYDWNDKAKKHRDIVNAERIARLPESWKEILDTERNKTIQDVMELEGLKSTMSNKM